MDTLFRLPAVPVKRKKRTSAQLQMLDLVALCEGQPLAGPLRKYSFTRRLLRRLIDAKLISIIAIGPARYKLTPLGRAVRSYGRGGRNESGRILTAAE